MDIEEAVTEFEAMLRLGTGALREIVSKDPAMSSKLEKEFGQLVALADRINDVRDNIRNRRQTTLRGISSW